MAIIYSYPTVVPTTSDLILGTDTSTTNQATKNFTVQSILDLFTVVGNDLQAVLDFGNVATGRDIILGSEAVPDRTIHAGTFTTGPGLANISGTTGAGFTTITSTSFTGALISTGLAAQIASGVQAVTQAPNDNSTKIATTAYVDGIVDPSILTFAGTTGGDQTVNLVAEKLSLLGTANQIESVSTGQSITFNFPTAGITLPDGSLATTQALTDTTTKVATTAFVHGKNDAQDLDFSGTAGTGSVLLNSQSLAVTGTALQITTAAAAQGLSIALTPSITISGTYTGTTFAGDLNGTINTATIGTTQAANNDSTLIATTKYVDNASSAQTLDYAGDATGPFSLNLSTDDLEFNGDSNITVTAATVATNKGIVTIDLNNDVTITGVMQAGTLSDGTFSGSAGTYTGGVSIASDLFVGPLAGNATTATSLATAGAITLLGDTTGGPNTYTSGGAVNLTTAIADSVVYNKTLAGFNATTGSVQDGDSIIEALERLQGQITTLPQGLVYQGIWSAVPGATGGGTPDLTDTAYQVNGHFYICDTAGVATPNGTGTTPNDWDVRDWVIFADDGAGGGVDEWQKIDNSSLAGGSGTTNTITKWTNNQTIGNSTITDDGSTVTIANTVDFIVQGNATLGNAASDTAVVKGPLTSESLATLSAGLNLTGGIDVGGTYNYGTAGQVLTNQAGTPSATQNLIWTTPTTGEVESISGLYGITVAGTTAIPTIAITADANNLIKLATVKTTPVGADTILINDSAATDVLKQVTLTSLKTFTSENWILSDGTNTTTIADGDTATFTAAGTGIAVAENNGTITITGSENPGSGTQFTLPVWDTTTSLGDSMVKQDAATGTTLTISGEDPLVIIDDTTTDKGSLTISRAADATTYMSSGTSTSGSETFGTHIFSQTDGTTPRSVITLNADRTTTFSDNIVIDQGNSGISRIHTGSVDGSDSGGLTLSGAGGTSAGRAAYIVLSGNENTGDARMLTGNTANAKLYLIAGATSGSTIRMQTAGSDTLVLDHSQNATFTGSASIGTTLTTGGSITVNTSGLLSITGGNNLTLSGTAANHSGLIFATNSVLPAVVSVGSNAVVDLGQNGNQFKDLYLSGNVIHGGSGTGTKGGTFNKLYTTGNAGVAGIAFTIDRASSGSMVFDVMLTSDNSNSVSIAKKFTVASRLGTQAPIFNKTIDTGPDGSNDFTAVFAADGTSTTKIKCTITPAGMNTQKIGVTIDLGFGQNDATVVMN